MMSSFDSLAEIIAEKFEAQAWSILTTNQRRRAREAASAVCDALDIGPGELAERLEKQSRR